MPITSLHSRLPFAMMLALLGGVIHAGPHGSFPAPAVDAQPATASGKQTAVFAGGCFWGVQSVFQRVKGVVATTAGYSGGSAGTATYDQVRARRLVTPNP
jgi:peptide-methionine (S)-S-oxide reductase